MFNARERFHKDFGPVIKKPIGVFSADFDDVDSEVQILVEDGSSGSSENVSRRLMVHQPPGTIPYKVNSTDTLSGIAARCKTTTSELTKINRLMSTMIFPGQNLFIPGEGYTPVTYRSLTPQPPRRHEKTSEPQQQPTSQTLLAPNSGGLFGRPRSSSWTPFNDEGNSKQADEKSRYDRKDLKPKKKRWMDRRKSTDDGRKGASTENLVSSKPLFIAHVQYATNTADRALIDGTLKVDGDTMKFEPDFGSGHSAAELTRYRLCLNRSTITATIFNSLPTSGKQATIYRRPAVSQADSELVTQKLHDDGAHKPDEADGTTSGESLSNSSPNLTETGSSDAPADSSSGAKFLSIKLGFTSQAIDDRPAIGSLIKSLMPKAVEIWIEHDFVIPADCVEELDASLATWLGAETAAEQEEKRDVVDADLKLGDKKKTPIRQFRRTLSAAELYNIPLPELSRPSNVIADSHIHALRDNLPPRADGRPWVLVYCSESDGFSLATLYRRMDGFNCPTLLVVQDTTNNIFGAVSLCPLEVSEGFYGSGEMFLFTFYPCFKKFAWTGRNSYFIRGSSGSLSIGASDGAFGLWLDDNLYRGRTQRCDTFDNDPLTSSSTQNVENSDKQAVDFTIKCVEVWAFV